jgi:hypothetical protein
VRPAGSLFSPLDQKLQLGVEGYSPAVLWRAIRQCQKACSFAEASADLRELAAIAISPTHLQRLSGRIGTEWKALRDAEVQAFKDKRLAVEHPQPPAVATVMVDGGRVRARADDAGRGVSAPGWRESKVAHCQSMTSTTHAIDPQPQPPRKFLDPVVAARLAAEIKARRGQGGPATATRQRQRPQPGKRPKRRKRAKGRPRPLVRSVVASLAGSELFGWQVAAEVQRRGLHRAGRKGYICDGQKYNWSIHEMHLLAWGFIPILDFIHVLAYLYAAAHAARGKGSAAGWALYERWLRWAWGGQVKELLGGLRAASAALGRPPGGCGEDDPRKVVQEALGYVQNNRERMDYARYRMLGLPVSSAAVESTIKQLNRRVKGSEKFWLQGGADAMLQLRAAHLSEDGTAQRYWQQPRPGGRAVGEGRLRPAA